MPNNKSAEKRLRQSEERRVQNKARKTELKTIRKQLLRAIHDGNQSDAEQTYRRFAKRVDQAAARRVLHPNTAARMKSRLAVQLKDVKAS